MDDRGRFDELYRAHHAELLRYATRRTDGETAREVVSETILIAWRRREDLPVPPARRAWLYGIARRVLANETRANARRQRLNDALIGSTPEHDDDFSDSAVEVAELRRLLEQLPTTLREALELVEWDGLEISEAAQVVGCSAGAFRVRLHRARAAFIRGYRQSTLGETERDARAPSTGGTSESQH